jgi:hypothetical protein
MKAEKVFSLIGKKLEKEYKGFGFKYARKYCFLRKRTKKYDYYIFFSPYFEYIPDTYIELRVTLIINDRVILKTNIYANSELLHLDLWKMGNHYNISDEALLNDTFTDLRTKIENYLIPQIKKLEGGTP